MEENLIRFSEMKNDDEPPAQHTAKTKRLGEIHFDCAFRDNCEIPLMFLSPFFLGSFVVFCFFFLLFLHWLIPIHFHDERKLNHQMERKALARALKSIVNIFVNIRTQPPACYYGFYD